MDGKCHAGRGDKPGENAIYCDGFTLVFEGATRSVRELTLYRDDTGQGFERNIRMEDGPFAACNRPITTFEVGGVLARPFSYIVSWEIDVAEFSPGARWSVGEISGIFRWAGGPGAAEARYRARPAGLNPLWRN